MNSRDVGHQCEQHCQIPGSLLSLTDFWAWAVIAQAKDIELWFVLLHSSPQQPGLENCWLDGIQQLPRAGIGPRRSLIRARAAWAAPGLAPDCPGHWAAGFLTEAPCCSLTDPNVLVGLMPSAQPSLKGTIKTWIEVTVWTQEKSWQESLFRPDRFVSLPQLPPYDTLTHIMLLNAFTVYIASVPKVPFMYCYPCCPCSGLL